MRGIGQHTQGGCAHKCQKTHIWSCHFSTIFCESLSSDPTGLFLANCLPVSWRIPASAQFAGAQIPKTLAGDHKRYGRARSTQGLWRDYSLGF